MPETEKKSISLIDVDGKWANLALMKISAWHKAKGDVVRLNGTKADIVYISCIFTKNRAKALGIASFYRSLGSKVLIGGSGINLTTVLPAEIENICPDYDLYNLDYSLGFSSRGCIRNCEFCIVPRKEGYIREVEMNWIKHNEIMLLYNNFLASPKAEEKLKFFIKKKYKVCFTQGLDIRLLTPTFAKLLSKVNSRSSKWRERRYYFAFDYPELEPLILEKIELLSSVGISPSLLAFYVLVGFNTTFDQDKRRVEVLHKQGCIAFVMKYHNKSPLLNKFAHWVNHRYYRVCPFEKFDRSLWRKNHVKKRRENHE